MSNKRKPKKSEVSLDPIAVSVETMPPSEADKFYGAFNRAGRCTCHAVKVIAGAVMAAAIVAISGFVIFSLCGAIYLGGRVMFSSGYPSDFYATQTWASKRFADRDSAHLTGKAVDDLTERIRHLEWRLPAETKPEAPIIIDMQPPAGHGFWHDDITNTLTITNMNWTNNIIFTQ